MADLFASVAPKRKRGRRVAQEIGIEEIKRAEDYLKGYRLNGKLLRLDKYAKEYFEKSDAVEYESIGEVPLARARMYEVRHFINSFPNCNEKLYLYYHYIKGESAERCGELFGISRSSSFRMKRRALIMAAEALMDRNAR